MIPAPRFVLDASIAIAWALPDEDHPLAVNVLWMLKAGSAIVPSIWWYEVRSILVLSERRGRTLPARSDAFLLNLERMRIEIDAFAPSPRVMELSRKHGLTAHDAAYLALALRDRLGLATLDAALASAATLESVPLIA